MNKEKLKWIRLNYTTGTLSDILDAILEEEPEQWIPPDGCPVYVWDSIDYKYCAISTGNINNDGHLICYINGDMTRTCIWQCWKPIPGVTFNEE